MKCERDVIRTYNQMQSTDKFSKLSSIIWTNWLNGSVLVYQLSGCKLQAGVKPEVQVTATALEPSAT